MKKWHFKNPVFITTALEPKNYPKAHLPEVAVAGRSNVGKSSLLNDLFQRAGMVKTSAKPGKTQALNFFVLNEELSFVDLPGYGYAEVPVSVRKKWGPMVQEYLQNREDLRVILFLFDIRRLPNDEDREFVQWVAANNKAMILVLTKVDKVTLNQRNINTQKILKGLDAQNIHYAHYSVLKKTGRKELIAMLTEALHDEGSHDTP